MDDITEVKYIRKKVFCDELLVPENIEFNDLEQDAMYVIVYDIEDNKKAVATGKINYNGTSCEIDKIAVLKEYRGLYYGDFTVKMLINKAFTAGVNDVYVICPITMKEFYHKIGFKIEEYYIQNNIQVCRMVIRADLVKKSCNGCKH